jgi:hypothetical protein
MVYIKYEHPTFRNNKKKINLILLSFIFVIIKSRRNGIKIVKYIVSLRNVSAGRLVKTGIIDNIKAKNNPLFANL